MADLPPPSAGARLVREFKAALPRNVIALGLVSFLTDASSDMMMWTTPFFIALLGGGFVWVGIVEGLRDGVTSFVTIAAGFLSDRTGRRKVLVGLGYGLSTAVKPVLALAAAPWHVAALLGLERVGKGIRGAPRDALVAASVSEANFGKAFSFHRMMDHGGAAVGQIAGLLLVLFLFPWFRDLARAGSAYVTNASDVFRAMYVLAAAPAALAVLAVIFLVREKAGPMRKKVELDFRAGYDRRFWYLLGIILVFTLGNSSDMFLLLRAGQILGYPLDFGAGEHEAMARQWSFPWQLPAMFFILSVAKMAFTLPGGFLADRIGRARTLLAGWAIYAVVYIAFGFATEAWQAWTLFIAYGLFYGFTEGVQKAVIADFVQPHVRGAAYGMAYFAEGIAKLVASPLFGALYAAFATAEHPETGAHVAFAFAGGCAAVACVLLAILIGVGRRNDTRPDKFTRRGGPGG
jgi:MFS family permease